METSLVEIFSSIQGEGTLVGKRQIFIRFAGCNLACRYCDTPESGAAPAALRFEVTPGQGDFLYLDNPVSPNQLLEIINGYELDLIHSLSLTGGEPLLHVDFIKAFIPLFRRQWPVKIYLETNGSLPAELSAIIDLIDIVGMDIKLPGVSGGPAQWQEHLEFLTRAAAKEVFVKIVISAATNPEEFLKAVSIINRVNPAIPLVIQPLTPKDSSDQAPDSIKVLELQDLALKTLADVRVIPQTHKLLGQL